MLEYGFATETSTAEVRVKTKEWCKGFTDAEMAVFHQHLPFICMSTGIGKIFDEAIPVLVDRLGVTDAKWLDELCGILSLDKMNAKAELKQWLNTKLIGYFTNCGFDTHREWLTRHLRALPRCDAGVDDDRVRFKMRAEYVETKVTAKRVELWWKAFDVARKRRLDETVVQVEIEVPVAV